MAARATSVRRGVMEEDFRMMHLSDDDPVVVTAVFRPGPGRRDRLLEALGPAIEAVHREAGCELYAIHDAPDGTVVMIEKWTRVADLDAHGAGPAVAELNRRLDGVLVSPIEVTRLAPLPRGQHAKGAL